MTEQQITPWEVSAGEESKEIDYTKVVEQFGCQHFTSEMAEKYGLDHIFFRRGIVFAHRDFDLVLNDIAKGKEIYLYTGRGPSSKSMHLGHAVPFLLCKYFQDKFGCKLVIQMTDDEKYVWKDITLEEAVQYGVENAKDIAAFGFDAAKTLILSNVKQAHKFVHNTLKIEKSITVKEYMKVFGFTQESKVGHICFPSKQMAPCFPSSFPSFLHSDAMCLIPASIDQDPYFRLARDVSNKVGAKKPASIYTYFLPALQGISKKMSASTSVSSIYLDDTQETIKKKINRHAYSGGRETLEEHREKGGDTTVDIAYQYLRFFLHDDEKLKQYEEGYRKGDIGSGEMKKLCIETVQKLVTEFQERRAKITQEVLDTFFTDKK